MELRNYENRIKFEENNLAPYAAKNSSNFFTKRGMKEEKDISRLDFQRDRDRIIHSRAFRRLMHKTQIFIANKGDHYRNRLTHSLEVSQIARSIANLLGLNESLTEAIALGHDLGHTPFGHTTERMLHSIISGKKYNNENSDIYIPEFGGFKHNFQSLHIVDNVESENYDKQGMNLTLAVREGILKHTKTKYKTEDINYSCLDLTNINIDRPSFTLEGQAVAIADEIAQITHDLEDGIRAKIISANDIIDTVLVTQIYNDLSSTVKLGWKLEDITMENTVFIRNSLIKCMIGYLIDNVCMTCIKNLENNFPNGKYPERFDSCRTQMIDFGSDIKENVYAFQGVITELVINSEEVSITDTKANYIIDKLFTAFFKNPQQLPTYILNKYYKKKGMKMERKSIDREKLQKDPDFIRLICDHISGMTDQYASREYNAIYTPEFF